MPPIKAIKPVKVLRSRVTVFAIVLGLFLSAYFVATRPITPQLALVSSISVILFALPSYRAVLRLQGIKPGIVALSILGFYALLIESSALATGFPYGDFTYTDILGNKVFGLTPWTVAFAYPPILMLAYVAARNITQRFNSSHKGLFSTRMTIVVASLTALFALACDIVLDPAAVKLGFWYWDQPGWFYGVPLVNFAGWLLSGFIGGLIMQALSHYIIHTHDRQLPAALGYSGLATVWFWTAVNIWLGQWWPAIFGMALSIVLLRILRTALHKARSG